MARILISALLAAIVTFMWGFFWWGILAMQSGTYSAVSAEKEANVLSVLESSLPRSDVYFIPDPKQMHENGGNANADPAEKPFIKIYYRPKGSVSGQGEMMAKGFLHMFVSALFMATLLSFVTGSMCCYSARVAFVCSIGVFAGFWQQVGDMIWFHHPAGFSLFTLGYHGGAWLLAGLVIGAIVKGPREPASPAKP